MVKVLVEISKPVLYYLIRRIIIYVIQVFVILTIIFFLFRLMPGDPLTLYFLMMQQRYGYVISGTSEIIAKYKEIFGLDKDLFTQYACYMRELILHGNLGVSFLSFPDPAQKLILEALPWTIGLLGISTIISWIIGLIAGTLIGWYREKKTSTFLFTLSLYMSQAPYYYFAILLVLFFGYFLGVLPTGYAFSPGLTPSLNIAFIWDLIVHGFLPSLSIIVISACGWIISTRSLVILILGEDYLAFAEAKGLKKRRILNRYVLRNILLPQSTGLGMSLGFIFSGSFLVEWIFRYPGIGSLFIKAINSLDYNTAFGIVIISSIAVLTANLIIDLIYPFIDPRVTYTSS